MFNFKNIFIFYFKKITKFLSYSLFYIITIFTIKFLKFLKPKTTLIYNNCFGFGDFLFFCVEVRKLVNKNNKIFCYSKLQFETAKFFLKKKYILKSFFLMPKKMSESYLGYNFLLNNKTFKPLKLMSPHNKKIELSNFYNGTKSSIDFITKKINRANISDKLKKIVKKKTLCIYVKHFSKNLDDINFQVRQTRDISKIYKLLAFLSNLNLNIIILGRSTDDFIKKSIKCIIFNKINNIFFFKDLSKNYTISDQAYIALKSIGYLGSDSGANGFFGLLNKKHINIDSAYSKFHKYRINSTFLYKKVMNKNSNKVKNFVWKKKYNVRNNKILEVNYLKIKKVLIKKILQPEKII
jgi:hypothetical protein